MPTIIICELTNVSVSNALDIRSDGVRPENASDEPHKIEHFLGYIKEFVLLILTPSGLPEQLLIPTSRLKKRKYFKHL